MMSWLVNLLLLLPGVGALACFASPGPLARRVAITVSGLALAAAGLLAGGFVLAGSGAGSLADSQAGLSMGQTSLPWINAIGARYQVGVDGFSIPLLVLSNFLFLLSIIGSAGIKKSSHHFYGLMLLLQAATTGVFIAQDLILFFLCFELTLVPLYFLIGIWGGENRRYAAIKMVLFTLAGSFCLLGVMFMLFGKAGAGGQAAWTFVAGPDGHAALTSSTVAAAFANSPGLLAACFWLTLIAFCVKLAIVPVHGWLPDAHVQAPTPVSMILAGILLKLGGYGLIRVSFGLFPQVAMENQVLLGSIGVTSILFGGLCALGQKDLKKLVAYSSVSHMGFVLLGLAAMNQIGVRGAYFQMIAHGVSSAMMFYVVGLLYDRAHHRVINNFGGIWKQLPDLGGWALLACLASMGLPALCGFIGELLVILGAFSGIKSGTNPQPGYILGALAAFSAVITTAYTLWMFRRVFMGEPKPEVTLYEPLSGRESTLLALMGLCAITLGLWPGLVLSPGHEAFNAFCRILAQTP
jgi:NADH-quinone oxidoreductase subunit M